ncbi:MAG TPA: FlgO family outer membrane protein [Desulfurivibrionaceae bacterium]|nr:FlgO family outer membrane protein [Desulfurivibrionaceae bacterium]
MKRYRVQVVVGCLGLLLGLGSVSCASKTAKSEESEAPVKSAAAEEARQPNVNVNVVQNVAPPAPEAAPATAAPASAVQAQQRVPTNQRVFQYMPDASKSLGTETLLSEVSKEIAGKVFYELKDEGERNFTAKIAVVSAVPLSDLKRDSEFGRVMGEYLLTDLADRGLKVTELRLSKEISIVPQTGEFIMSRNIAELANHAPELDYVVVSTFSNTRKTLIVQGRLVALKDGQVKTSWRYSLPLNRELLGLFYQGEEPFKIAVKGVHK